MSRLLQKLSVLCLALVASMATWADIVEKTIYTTNFQDWNDISSSKTETTVSKTTTDGQDLNFYLMETQCDSDGTNTSKLTSECITPGFLMAAKTATPYIKTSSLKSVTTVTFVHAATGSKRGWGLKVKGDGDVDWVTVSDAVANPAGGQEVTVDVNRTNVSLWFYNLTTNQNAYMTSLEIMGNVEVAPRTFTDFKVDFRTDPYTVTLPESGTLPEGVQVTGSFNGNQHGYQNGTVVVPVDGPVKFTVGGCKYGSDVTVHNQAGTLLATLATKAADCDNNTSTKKNVEWTYNNESADVLTFTYKYLPYIFAEKCEYVEDVTVSYYNTDSTLIGEDIVEGGSMLAYNAAYAQQVIVPEGMAFRGWFEAQAASATKVREGVELEKDLKLYAKATAIEKAVVGTHFDWDLTKKYFYVEDHEAISIPGGVWHDVTHGWTVAKTNSVKIAVGGKAVVSIKNCKYSNTQTITATNKNGDIVAKLDFTNGGVDGAVWNFQYDGAAPDTLTITYPSVAYVHGVEVYNVADFVEKDATGYYIVPAGDGANAMMLIKTAQKGDKIFLPNGTYDFGNTCLTSVPDSVSIIGESQNGTIIQNTPLEEGLGSTATLLLTGSNIYIQDLSLRCSSELCATASASRCVTIQDKGTNNICKNVSLLSGQDTYYSVGGYKQRAYFENCYIEGTVDFISGGGDVVFNKSKLYVRERSTANVIVAANTDKNTQWGYVMLDNTIDCADNQVGKYNFGRPWNGSPACTWINTKVLKTGSDAGYRNMTNNLVIRYHEYNTHDSNDNEIMTHNLNACGAAPGSDEIYLSSDVATTYDLANIFADNVYPGVPAWHPDVEAEQVTEIPNEGGIFLLEDGTITTTLPTSGKVRVANSRGGFGPMIDTEATSISTANADTVNATAKFIENNSLVIVKDGKKYNVLGAQIQ